MFRLAGWRADPPPRPRRRVGRQRHVRVGPVFAQNLDRQRHPDPLHLSQNTQTRRRAAQTRAAAMRAASRRAVSVLGQAAARPRRRPPVISVTAFSVPPMIPVAGRDVIGHDPVAALAGALGGRVALHVVGLRREAHHQPGALRGLRRHLPRMSGFSVNCSAGGRPESVLLDLLPEAFSTRQSATAAAKTAMSAGSAPPPRPASRARSPPAHGRRRRAAARAAGRSRNSPARPGRASAAARPCPARPRSGWRCSAPGRSAHGSAPTSPAHAAPQAARPRAPPRWRR
jgi:hypothetical protein